MRHAGIVDFLFTGLALVPTVLLLSGHIGPAMLLFVPLLIAACLTGMYQQQTGGAVAEDPAPDSQAPLAGVADDITASGEPRRI